MIRHPIYIAICLFASGYLAISGAKGWSLFQSFSNRLTSAHGPSSFNHK
jgi:protein-S-isoprenylcysteine O-methyltransferase Ste14